MKEWWLMMLKKHGERVFWMLGAAVFAFMFFGIAFIDFTGVSEKGQFWLGSSGTILIGLGMLCYNKARGSDVVKDEEPKP